MKRFAREFVGADGFTGDAQVFEVLDGSFEVADGEGQVAEALCFGRGGRGGGWGRRRVR